MMRTENPNHGILAKDPVPERPKFIEAGHQQKLLNLFYNHLATGNLETSSAFLTLIYKEHSKDAYNVINEIFTPQRIRNLYYNTSGS